MLENLERETVKSAMEGVKPVIKYQNNSLIVLEDDHIF